MSDLHKQNKQAILEGLREVNDRMSDLVERLNRSDQIIAKLHNEVNDLKRAKLIDIAATYGSGPTTL